MPKSILIIQGHPDPSEARFCQVIAETYAQEAQSAGHHTTILRLADFDPVAVRTYDDFYTDDAPAVYAPAVELLCACDHLVIIFPLWLGAMPGYTRLFFEQLLRPGVALEKNAEGFPKTLLDNKSARVIVTMGMPGFVYRWYYGAHGVRGFVKNALKFCGIKPVRTCYFGMMDSNKKTRFTGYLDQVRRWALKAT